MTPAEALRAVCDAWEVGDPDAAASLFAADGVYEDPLYPAPLAGPDAIRAGLAEGMGAIEDCRVTLDPVVEDGDHVLAVGFFASRLRDGGDRFDFPFAIRVELRDGRIARLSEYFDTKPLVP
ncbi:MAG TPA: nuclear transport factor 2 family protein [Gaiellales bacterium]|nr:nuclear transport factor 2 family protein [Gaiellales bacterium]